MRAEGTPVPIPNTTVKIRAADGTMLETAWESRRLPDIFYIHVEHVSCFACDERSGAKMDILFPDADGVQNVIQTDMCRAHAVHTLKTE